uniref:Secreted protein n=1 Tax=Anopheles darlingi TaxID=43151 RepID=A0A2M4D7B6_ANODA
MFCCVWCCLHPLCLTTPPNAVQINGLTTRHPHTNQTARAIINSNLLLLKTIAEAQVPLTAVTVIVVVDAFPLPWIHTAYSVLCCATTTTTTSTMTWFLISNPHII